MGNHGLRALALPSAEAPLELAGESERFRQLKRDASTLIFLQFIRTYAPAQQVIIHENVQMFRWPEEWLLSRRWQDQYPVHTRHVSTLWDCPHHRAHRIQESQIRMTENMTMRHGYLGGYDSDSDSDNAESSSPVESESEDSEDSEDAEDSGDSAAGDTVSVCRRTITDPSMPSWSDIESHGDGMLSPFGSHSSSASSLPGLV